ncbi:DUF6438 domain-containing protein [Chryseobacterium koreense]|uniref:DUF6438 domain-containing protein n=1 Tax=Chryseobacterium koreense TaxID=232216 RepID=UPI0026F0C84A|nr:DUF6438 domain-containing protein [Chryseobacterium koreense]
MNYLLTFISAFLMISCATSNKTNYSKIEYDAGACFGFCAIFKMTINPDRTAIIDAERFTFYEGNSKADFSKPKEGTFKTTLDRESFDKLVGMLDSLNLKSLKNYYGNKNITDLPTSHLRITFNDNSTKHVEDYGKNGTEDLHRLYTLIEGLTKNQTWTKVK